MVHVNADELLADGFDEQSGDYGAVHTAGEGQQDFLITDLLTQFSALAVFTVTINLWAVLSYRKNR